IAVSETISQDICQFFQSDGRHNGLKIYRHRELSGDSYPQSTLFKGIIYGNGLQWEFTIERQLIGNMSIRVIDTTGRPFNQTIVNRFVIFGDFYNRDQKWENYIAFHDMIYEDPKDRFGLHIWLPNGTELWLHNRDIEYNATDIMFRSTAIYTNNYVMILDRHTGVVLTYNIRPDVIDNTSLAIHYNRVDNETADLEYNTLAIKPLFLEMIPDFLRQQLEAIIDYEIVDEESGYMLWFSIDGELRYCFTPGDGPLSQQHP
ncbi:unnamed protein product, partial [Medioppia subpectinata]